MILVLPCAKICIHMCIIYDIFITKIEGLTAIIFVSSTVWRNQMNDTTDEKYETNFQFFMMTVVHFFMPVLNIYPSVYIWYDYQTNNELAYSPRARVMNRSNCNATTSMPVCHSLK